MSIILFRHRAICFLIVTMSFFKGHGSSDLNNYFISLRNLDYQGAKNQLKEIGDAALKKECELLADILYFSGQQEINFVDKSFKNDTEKYLIHKLSRKLFIECSY